MELEELSHPTSVVDLPSSEMEVQVEMAWAKRGLEVETEVVVPASSMGVELEVQTQLIQQVDLPEADVE